MAEDLEVMVIHEVLESGPETQTYLVDIGKLEASKPDLVKAMRETDYGVSVDYNVLEELWDVQVEPPAMVQKIIHVFEE